MRTSSDHEGEARAASATGPIRRVPSTADTTRVNSFPGSLTAYASHYSPYGSAFAAAAAQQAAVAAASDPPAGSDPQSVHHQLQPHRRPPLRQHSFDHRLVLQRQLHKQQQAYGMHCHAGRATGSCSDLRHLAHHTLNCICGECAAARQQRPLQHQEQQQQQGMCDTTFGAAGGCTCPPGCSTSCAYLHQQHQQVHLQSSSRLGPMFSGPPSFGSEMATELAATTTVANAGSFLRPQWTDGSSEQQDAAAAAAAAAAAEAEARPRVLQQVPAHLTDAYAQHQFFRHLGNGLGFGTERRAATDGGSTGQQSQQQQLLQFVHEQQQQQQHYHHHHHEAVLLHRQLQGNHMPSLAPMMSAPPSTTLQAAAAVHPAAAARMYQIPAGLAAIRLRPQAAAVRHTAQEAELAHSCRLVGFGTSDAAGAQAAAAGRDMVPGPQQLHLQQQGSDAMHGLGCEQETALPYRQPQLRQQELQLLLQHQLRQLVPGAGSGAGGVHSSSSAQGLEINLQDPAVLLELLRHSGMCKVPEEACALGWRCTWVKRLWIHMHTCRSGACTSVHCRLGKQVLPHYKECSDAACQMCQRVRGFDKALDELQALTARASSWAGESVDSQGTADTPSTVYIAGEQDGAAPDGGAAVDMSPALSVTSKPVNAGAAQQQQQGHNRAHDDEEVEQGVLMRQQFFPETW